MRNKVAKKLRKEAGSYENVKKNTSDKLLYKELKRKHKYHTQHPKLKENKGSTLLQKLSFLKLISAWRHKASIKNKQLAK